MAAYSNRPTKTADKKTLVKGIDTSSDYKKEKACDGFTPVGRLSYANIAVPRDDKQSVDILFPKESTDLTVIEALVMNALIEKHGPGKKIPPKWKIDVIKDGDEKYDSEDEPMEEYEGYWYISVNNPKCEVAVFDGLRLTNGVPTMLHDGKSTDIPDDVAAAIYSGVYGQAKLWAFWYDIPDKGVKGVALRLLSICRIKDGEKLASTSGDSSADAGGFAIDADAAGAYAGQGEGSEPADDDVPF